MAKPNEYKRIIEILNDYWLSEPDEEEVIVLMRFKHHYGMEQEKEICWRNPKFIDDKEPLPEIVSLADIAKNGTTCDWCGQKIKIQ